MLGSTGKTKMLVAEFHHLPTNIYSLQLKRQFHQTHIKLDFNNIVGNFSSVAEPGLSLNHSRSQYCVSVQWKTFHHASLHLLLSPCSQIKQCSKLKSTQSQTFSWTTYKFILPVLFTSPLFLSLAMSTKQSFHILRWREKSPKKNDKSLWKEQVKWCESESRAEVTKGRK